jgi:hypothetical protein
MNSQIIELDYIRDVEYLLSLTREHPEFFFGKKKKYTEYALTNAVENINCKKLIRFWTWTLYLINPELYELKINNDILFYACDVETLEYLIDILFDLHIHYAFDLSKISFNLESIIRNKKMFCKVNSFSKNICKLNLFSKQMFFLESYEFFELYLSELPDQMLNREHKQLRIHGNTYIEKTLPEYYLKHLKQYNYCIIQNYTYEQLEEFITNGIIDQTQCECIYECLGYPVTKALDSYENDHIKISDKILYRLFQKQFTELITQAKNGGDISVLTNKKIIEIILSNLQYILHCASVHSIATIIILDYFNVMNYEVEYLYDLLNLKDQLSQYSTKISNTIDENVNKYFFQNYEPKKSLTNEKSETSYGYSLRQYQQLQFTLMRIYKKKTQNIIILEPGMIRFLYESKSTEIIEEFISQHYEAFRDINFTALLINTMKSTEYSMNLYIFYENFIQMINKIKYQLDFDFLFNPANQFVDSVYSKGSIKILDQIKQLSGIQDIYCVPSVIIKLIDLCDGIPFLEHFNESYPEYIDFTQFLITFYDEEKLDEIIYDLTLDSVYSEMYLNETQNWYFFIWCVQKYIEKKIYIDWLAYLNTLNKGSYSYDRIKIYLNCYLEEEI